MYLSLILLLCSDWHEMLAKKEALTYIRKAAVELFSIQSPALRECSSFFQLVGFAAPADDLHKNNTK